MNINTINTKGKKKKRKEKDKEKEEINKNTYRDIDVIFNTKKNN